MDKPINTFIAKSPEKISDKKIIKREEITSEISNTSHIILNDIKLLNLISLSKEEKMNLKNQLNTEFANISTKHKNNESKILKNINRDMRSRVYSDARMKRKKIYKPLTDRKGNKLSMTLSNLHCNKNKVNYNTTYKKTMSRQVISHKNIKEKPKDFFITGTNEENNNLASTLSNFHCTTISNPISFRNKHIDSLSPLHTIAGSHFKKRTHQLTLFDIQRKFPKNKYNLICKTIDENVKRDTIYSNQLMQKTIKTPLLTEHKEESEKEFLVDNNTSSNSQKKKMAHVYNKTAGMLAIIDKASADIINFGDNYLRLSDADFYLRAKEILKKYNDLRQTAKMDYDTAPVRSRSRAKIHSNMMIISRKYENIQRESLKLRNMLESYKIK